MFEHNYSFDPSGGLSLEQLFDVPVPPLISGFADFWQTRYEQCLTLAPRARFEVEGPSLPGRLVERFCFTSSEGCAIRGWLVLPEHGPVERALIVGHGYAGRDRPDTEAWLERCAVVYPCFRGLGASRGSGLASNPLFHVLHKIRDRQAYVIGGCVDDLWLAITILLQRLPQVAGRIAYLGCSFGGGIGALAAPWDARIRRLVLEVPTFGHQALRLQSPCVGSGEAVRIYQRHHDWDVRQTLDYYDAAMAAGFIDIPTLVAAARFDPAVPPAGQFALYNALPVSRRRLFILDAGHFPYPAQAEQQAAWAAEVKAFLAHL